MTPQDQPDPVLLEEFAKDMKTFEESGAGMPFVFTPSEAFQLLAIMQLALRHPELKGPTAAFGYKLALSIQDRLCKTPALQEVARRGWDR